MTCSLLTTENNPSAKDTEKEELLIYELALAPFVAQCQLPIAINILCNYVCQRYHLQWLAPSLLAIGTKLAVRVRHP